MLIGAWRPGCFAQPGTPHVACHNSPRGVRGFSFPFFPSFLPSFPLSLFPFSLFLFFSMLINIFMMVISQIKRYCKLFQQQLPLLQLWSWLSINSDQPYWRNSTWGIAVVFYWIRISWTGQLSSLLLPKIFTMACPRPDHLQVLHAYIHTCHKFRAMHLIFDHGVQ